MPVSRDIIPGLNADMVDGLHASEIAQKGLGPAGGDLSGNWPNLKVIGLQGRPVADVAPSTNQLLTWTGSQWAPAAFPPAGGDLSGNWPTITVVGLQGRPVASTAPSTGQVLQWNGTSWAPATVTASTRYVWVRLSANQSIPSGAWTRLSFNTIIAGDSSMFDSTNNRIIIPEAGKWFMLLQVYLGLAAGLTLPTNPFRFMAQIQYKRPADTTSRAARVEEVIPYNAGIFQGPTVVVAWVDDLPENSIVKAGIYQGSGASLPIWGGTADYPAIDGETTTYTFTSLAVWKYAA